MFVSPVVNWRGHTSGAAPPKMHDPTPKAPECPSSLSGDPQAVTMCPRPDPQNPSKVFPVSGDPA